MADWPWSSYLAMTGKEPVPVWGDLKQRIYLGDEQFAEQMQKHLKDTLKLKEITPNCFGAYLSENRMPALFDGVDGFQAESTDLSTKYFYCFAKGQSWVWN